MKCQETEHGLSVNYLLTQGHQARAALCNVKCHRVYLTPERQGRLPDVFVNQTQTITAHTV